MPTRPHQTEPPHKRDQASSGKASTSILTRSHQAEPLYLRQPGLIRQNSTPTSTRSHWAELPYQRQPRLIGQSLYTRETKPHQAVPPHQCQPSLIRQSLHINVNQVLSDRVSALTPTRLYQAYLRTDANQVLLGCISMYITIWLIIFYDLVYYSILSLKWSE